MGEQSWPGPDLYTLRGIVELEVALTAGVTVDAAHAVLGDGATRAFGARWYEWVVEALTAEGRAGDDLAVLLSDDVLAERVLQHVRTRMTQDEDAPDLPETRSGWYAYAPGDPAGGREAFRRAVRRRRWTARQAQFVPPRARIAGRRRLRA